MDRLRGRRGVKEVIGGIYIIIIGKINEVGKKN
jgi:hypothetical protein